MITSAALHAQQPITLPQVLKPDMTPLISSPKSRAATDTSGKRQKLIAIKDARITRNQNGSHNWTVHINALANQQIPPNTAKLIVYQNMDGKRRLIDSRTFDRQINPGYGILTNDFVPSSEDDLLEFELVQKDPASAALSQQKFVVDRAKASVPPFGITLSRAGYAYVQEDRPPYLYAHVANQSNWPLRARIMMRAGKLSAWTTERHREIVTIPAGQQIAVQKDWEYTDKGPGYYYTTVQLLLTDPGTGKASWKDVLDKKAPLPTRN
jgi:hypothetical protein